MQHFFETAPQNPYVFAGLVLLALIAAWQPVYKIALAVSSIYRDVVHEGLRRAVIRVTEYTDRKAERIFANPAKGALRLLTDLAWSMTIAMNSIFMFLLGIAVLLFPPQELAPGEELFRTLFGAFALFVAGLSTLVWLVDAALQSLMFVKLRNKLKQDV